jgi:carboxyl-terminal processing protease
MKTRTLMACSFYSLGVALTLLAARISQSPITPNQEQANITQATAALLENSQLAHRRLDAELSGKFLDHYLDALDPDHLLLHQSDLDEFDAYRPELAAMTRRRGDASPAQAIYARYLDRLTERAAYTTNLLATAEFDFAGHDTWVDDRRTAPRPKDMAECQALWKQQLRAAYLQEKLGGESAENIVKTLTRRYDRVLQVMRKLSQDEILEVYLDSLAHAYDPHSDYLGHEQLDSFNIAMNLSLCGVGATLQSTDGYCTLRDLVPGGPAARSGLLKVGDRIVAVAQDNQEPVDVVDMPLSQTVGMIRGPKGTRVLLSIIPAGGGEAGRKTVCLVRDEIKLEDQRAKASVLDLPQSQGDPLRLGVIDVPSFYGQTEGPSDSSVTDDVSRLLKRLKRESIRGLVLDLRGNGGGSLEEAIRLTGLFIRQGPVVQTRGRDGEIATGNDPDPTALYTGPMVVLISRLSASASEILAGALQDYDRAVVVGDTSTFGKGTVQTLLPLAAMFERYGIPQSDDPGAVKVTISKFYRPGGSSTQLRGVASDIVIPSQTDLQIIGEREMSDPLPWDTVPPARFSRLGLVQPVLPVLRSQSAARIAEDPAFKILQQRLSKASAEMSAKSISLNEAERREEKEKADALETELKQMLHSRASAPPEIHDITMKSVDVPKLDPARKQVESEPTKADPTPASGAPEAGTDSNLASVIPDLVLAEAENILADYVRAVEEGAAAIMVKR